MNPELRSFLAEFARGQAPVTVLTGAGISAESGIPTFRGPEGYWTVGSAVYQPQEMATLRMFHQDPEEVWRWYLYRLGVCSRAAPNAGHRAIVAMERFFGDRFTLITQNVDGLHLAAGNSLPRTYQIHGNLRYMRCREECSSAVHPLPEALYGRGRETPVTREDLALLTCPACGHMTRPHVLWFDETYDEVHYRFYSSMETAARTRLLIVVGTSGATNLPNQVVHEVYRRGGAVIDINIEENPFSRMAARSPGGAFLQTSSSQALGEMMAAFSGR
ncbi:MAG: SIR2 family NAD-dependent protein deacylase [Thermodesulfobacteriota bacterium]